MNTLFIVTISILTPISSQIMTTSLIYNKHKIQFDYQCMDTTPNVSNFIYPPKIKFSEVEKENIRVLALDKIDCTK
jgi:hypothetical protein